MMLQVMAPSVSVVTAHGRQELIPISPEERLLDLLIRNDIPWSGVSIYGCREAGQALESLDCLDRPVGELGDFREVLLYFNRNVNPFLFSLRDFAVVDSPEGADPSTEYFYQTLDNDSGSASTVLKKLSPQECRSIIAERVAEMIEATMPDGGDLVVGVSGGGDSNALLHGLSRLEQRSLRVHPVILKGIPDWDQGLERAEALCHSYGMDLAVVEEADVRTVLGIPQGGASLIDRFEREFAGDDFEFMGTLLIRLVLAEQAKQRGARYFATGLNLEDVACESLFRLSNGLKPASMPARAIGDARLLFPLWLCPKRVIDGCFPSFSLKNYDARYPCFSLGRNYYYSVAYQLQSQFPGFLERFVKSLSTIAAADPVEYHHDDMLGFPVERFVPFPLRQKFARMVA